MRHARRYSEQVLMGWSSGGAMASAFLDHAHRANFITPNKTRYSVKGLVLLSSGGQYCYAYDTIADLAGSSLWSACNADAKPFGCCPSNLTEDHYWRHPQEYTRHPPTLLVQSIQDSDADWDAARFYHGAMTSHGGTSTYALARFVACLVRFGLQSTCSAACMPELEYVHLTC